MGLNDVLLKDKRLFKISSSEIIPLVNVNCNSQSTYINNVMYLKVKRYSMRINVV